MSLLTTKPRPLPVSPAVPRDEICLLSVKISTSREGLIPIPRSVTET